MSVTDSPVVALTEATAATEAILSKCKFTAVMATAQHGGPEHD